MQRILALVSNCPFELYCCISPGWSTGAVSEIVWELSCDLMKLAFHIRLLLNQNIKMFPVELKNKSFGEVVFEVWRPARHASVLLTSCAVHARLMVHEQSCRPNTQAVIYGFPIATRIWTVEAVGVGVRTFAWLLHRGEVAIQPASKRLPGVHLHFVQWQFPGVARAEDVLFGEAGRTFLKLENSFEVVWEVWERLSVTAFYSARLF